MRTHQNFERQNSRGEYRNNYRNQAYGRSRDRNRSTERPFLETLVAIEKIGVQAKVGQGQDQGQV